MNGSSSYGGGYSGQSSGREQNRTSGTPRRWDEKGFLPFWLEPLTPVFIGSGEDLSPLEYVIRKENDGYVLHIVDSAAWLATEQQDSAVSAALNRGEMLTLRRLINERLDEKSYSLARLPITSNPAAETLLKHISNPRSLSNAEVQTFVRNPLTHTAFVPGSSLKGAISTAIIDHVDNQSKGKRQFSLKDASLKDYKYGYRNALEEMFGRITDHAMQALKVGDIAVPPDGTRVVTAEEKRLQPGKPGTPKPLCECLPPFATENRVLYGHLHLDSRSGEPAIKLPDEKNVPLRDLVEWCNAFYARRFRDEWQKFYCLPHFAKVKTTLAAVKERIEKLDPKREILLRVGHYSHVECVTVTENAPQGKKGFGKTRTLADGTWPFGWVLLHLCTEEEYRTGRDAVERVILEARHEQEVFRANREAALREALEQRFRKAEAAEQARKEAEAEALRREREAAERQKKLDSLSPEERVIEELSFPEASEQKSSELYALLDTLSADMQVRAATALKAYWGRIGKWEGKKLAPKQEKKVKRIKTLLGE